MHCIEDRHWGEAFLTTAFRLWTQVCVTACGSAWAHEWMYHAVLFMSFVSCIFMYWCHDSILRWERGMPGIAAHNWWCKQDSCFLLIVWVYAHRDEFILPLLCSLSLPLIPRLGGVILIQAQCPNIATSGQMFNQSVPVSGALMLPRADLEPCLFVL